MNEANTNTQGGSVLQSLQPQGNLTQQTSSNFQTGSGVSLSNSDTTKLLNQSVGTGKLSVAVANANTQASIAPPENTALKTSGIPAAYIFIPMALLILVAILVYRKMKKFDKETLGSSAAEEILLEEVATITKTKKKRKKPKRPHHH